MKANSYCPDVNRYGGGLHRPCTVARFKHSSRERVTRYDHVRPRNVVDVGTPSDELPEQTIRAKRFGLPLKNAAIATYLPRKWGNAMFVFINNNCVIRVHYIAFSRNAFHRLTIVEHKRVRDSTDWSDRIYFSRNITIKTSAVRPTHVNIVRSDGTSLDCVR